MFLRAIIISVVAGLVSGANANLVVNGSFEEGNFTGSAFTRLPTGSTGLTGWTVGGAHGVDWHSNDEFRDVYDGKYCVDLNWQGGSNPANYIEQSFATTVGQKYMLSFAMCGPGLQFVDPRVVIVDIGNVHTQFSVPRSYNYGLEWQFKTFTFTGNGNTTLRFTGNSDAGAYWGPVIDKVSVTTVPEPSSAAALAGIACATLLRRRVR